MRQQLNRMGILSAVGLLAVGTAAQAAPKSAPLATPPNLALVGVTQVGDRSQAWLMDTDSRTKETVSPGGTAFGFRVKSVGPERVVLTRGGKEYALRLGERQIPTVAAVPVRTASPTVSGRLVLPRTRTLSNAFTAPVFLTTEPEVTDGTAAIAQPTNRARALTIDPNVDPRLLPDIYPGYGALGAYGLPPGYGFNPGYGFDPSALGYGNYPVSPEEAAGYPSAVFGYPGAMQGYPGYYGAATPEEAYLFGMTPYASATTWGSPYAGYSPFSGNGLDLSAPRWSRQSGRRQNVDPFRGEISVNPQTQRRRARFSFPTQGQ